MTRCCAHIFSMDCPNKLHIVRFFNRYIQHLDTIVSSNLLHLPAFNTLLHKYYTFGLNIYFWNSGTEHENRLKHKVYERWKFKSCQDIIRCTFNHALHHNQFPFQKHFTGAVKVISPFKRESDRPMLSKDFVKTMKELFYLRITLTHNGANSIGNS